MRKLALLALLVCVALSTVSSAGVLREIWWGGASIEEAIELVNSGTPADQLDILAQPSWVNIADNYVARMSGWLTVPADGEYTFYVSGDDYQRLYVSQDDDPANAEMVAFVDGWTGSQDWTKYDTQASAPMTLVEGQVLAIVGIMQEGGGGDGQDWGWITPGSEEITLIPGEYLSHPYETIALSPSPADGASGVIDAVLSWDAPAVGEDPVYDVYFGTDPEALAPIAEGIVETTVDAGTAGIDLDFETTYYWRVDTSGTEGLVWSFTTEPMTFAVENIVATSNGTPQEGSGPEKTLDGAISMEPTDQWLAAPPEGEALWIQYEFPRALKLVEMTVFNSNTQFESMLGYGAKDVTVEYSVDGEEWMVLADVELAQATETVVDMAGVAAKLVRLTINSNWGGLFTDSGLTEVSFAYVPTYARLVAPADDATGVNPAAVLDWYAGRDAVSSDVLINGELVATVEDSNYDPDLIYGMVYDWQVNENDGAMVWEGDEWSFTTAEFVPVASDVLVYGEDANDLVVDMEGADLTAYAPDTLRVAYQGNPVDFVEEDGVVTMGASGADIWGSADQFRYAYQTLNGDADLIVRVDSLTNVTNTWAKAGFMIRQSTEPGAIHADTLITGGDGGGGTFQWRDTPNAESFGNRALEGVVDIDPGYYARLVREGNTFTGYFSVDGVEWQEEGTVDVNMVDPVLVGLAVTSHDAGNSVIVQMSEISMVGDITGDLTVEAIGADMPANDAASLYVSVEDAAGGVATVVTEDAAATQALSTQNWNIPLASLEGVDLANVATVTVGAGTPDAPAEGSGTVDVTISVGTPLSHNVMADVTSAADEVVGVPNDGLMDGDNFGWPEAETPDLAVDNNVETKFLHFKGELEPTGIQVTPAVGATLVTGIALTTANDAPERDPITFELYGSNESIDGPYELIASGDVVDFAQEEAWPRFTKNTTAITFENEMTYTHYQVLFPTLRDPASANSMQIAEIELIGVSSY